MKIILRSACLLFIVFLFFTIGFAGQVRANDPDPYNYAIVIDKNYTTLGEQLPEGDYPVWGYTGRSYNFSIKYNCSPEDFSTTTMVFYWDCPKNASNKSSGNPSDYTYFLLNNTSHWGNKNVDKPEKWKCTHIWNNPRDYSVAVGVFKQDGSKAISFWIPIKITNEADINVKSVLKSDEQNSSAIDNNTYIRSVDNSEKVLYCGYVKNDYSFSVNHSATNKTLDDYRTIDETTTVVNWGNDTLNDTGVLDITEVDSKKDPINITWAKNFTHRWSSTGEKKISATAFHWDPFDWSERYSNYEYASMLIIRDPKNFFFDSDSLITKPFSNLHNLGIFLITAGLVILFFAITKNNIPVKIAILGLKPFYLKAVDFFIGIFTFITGMYLYIVFSRCPWDIPIISIFPRLPDAYFSMLYYEYKTNTFFDIPYLTILLCLLVVFALSMILYRIGIPIISGESKSGNFLSQKAVHVLRSSISRFSLRFKELYIQMKERVRRINLTEGKVTRLKSESGKKEKM